MRLYFWSFLLQWSRFGVNAAVFLFATHFLTLAEIGEFALAFAPIKLAQGIHKAGIVEAVVVKNTSDLRLNTLFGFSVLAGFVVSTFFALGAVAFELPGFLILLAFIPILLGLSSVSDGLLRKRLHLRTMALRTAFSQITAAVFAVSILYSDTGIDALVAYAVANVALAAGISILMARWVPTKLAKTQNIAKISRSIFDLAGRDAINSSILPLAQIAIGLRFGLNEAGAFQIATRMLTMLDALTLSPLRYLALPALKHSQKLVEFNVRIATNLRLGLTLACWVWCGLAVAAADILTLVVGEGHANTTTPLLLSMVPLGLGAAVAMPFTQALIVRGHANFVFKRAVVLFACSTSLVTISLFHSTFAVVIALSVASAVTLVWFVASALERLDLNPHVLKTAANPSIAGIVMMLALTALDLPLVAEIPSGTALYFGFLYLLTATPKAKTWA